MTLTNRLASNTGRGLVSLAILGATACASTPTVPDAYGTRVYTVPVMEEATGEALEFNLDYKKGQCKERLGGMQEKVQVGTKKETVITPVHVLECKAPGQPNTVFYWKEGQEERKNAYVQLPAGLEVYWDGDILKVKPLEKEVPTVPDYAPAVQTLAR